MKKPLRVKFTKLTIDGLGPPIDRDRYYVYDTAYVGL